MGKSSSTVIGYHYRLALHIGLARGEIDAFLEFRAADKPAWRGELTASARIQIHAPQLFGGEKDQGGITGPVDLMFGEAGQLPNAYLRSVFGEQIAAWRGFATLAFAGGRYGAMSPFPQKPSFKLRKILEGWDAPGCWYPETAAVPLQPDAVPTMRFIASAVPGGSTRYVTAPLISDWTRPSVSTEQGGSFILGPDRLVSYDSGIATYTFDGITFFTSTGTLGGYGGPRRGVYYQARYLIAGWLDGLYHSADNAATFQLIPYPSAPRVLVLGATSERLICTGTSAEGNGIYFIHAASHSGPWSEGAVHGLGSHTCVGSSPTLCKFGGTNEAGSAPWVVSTSTGADASADALPAFASAAEVTCIASDGSGNWVLGTDTGEIAYKLGSAAWTLAADGLGAAASGVTAGPGGWVMVGASVIKTSANMHDWTNRPCESIPYVSVAALPWHPSASLGMNAAHALYYVATDAEKGRQPREDIDDTNLRTAADLLYSEGFGLCWEYNPEGDTPDGFIDKVCRIIAGSFERSVIDGKWRLTLLRADYDFDALPIISDSDGPGGGLITAFKELPSTLDSAVNCVGVRFFDIERKESRTIWARAPGLIRQFGEIRELLDFRWVPNPALAARIAERELRTYITPRRSFEITTDPSYRGIERYQTVRFQTPNRGIADIVCIVGDKQTGTLRSGAINWVLTQHVFSFADTQLVEVEDGVDTRPPQVPVPIEQARVYEAPYIDVSAALPRAELAALPSDVGYLIAVAARPSVGLDYSMHVEPAGGEYTQVANGEWCPTAMVVGAVPRGIAPVVVTLANGSYLDRARVGMAVLWDEECGRLEAIDIEAMTATIARACGDTVPQLHAPGSRLWLIGDDVASDVTEYTDGETIDVKLLPSTGSQRLPIADATALPLTFDSRQARPYPPANVTVNGESYPASVTGDVEVSAVHRDRVLQADQLMDQTVGDIGPEAGTTYIVRNIDAATGTETHYAAGITAWPHLVPSADLVISNRLEVYSIRDGRESWQRVIVPFTVGAVLLAEDASPITAEDGDPIIME